jgi:ABC-type multidrug transport system fused ATPase/permease subunit
MRNIFKFRVTGFLTMLAAIAVFSVVTMLLWNALMPQIFTLPTLNYWQAAGLMLLARILFGGFMHDMAGHGGRRGRGDGHFFQHGNKLREKWMNMSEEERKEFMEKEKDFFKLYKGFSRFNGFFGDEENKKDDKND